MTKAVLFCTFGFCLATAANAQPWTGPPRLVVGVVVDQMRTDYIYRYWNNFGEEGFKRLVREGSFQREAHYDHVPTYTAPGHASIYTGTTPAHHGIVANHPYRRELGKTWYIARDTTVQGVGTTSDRGQRSPSQLLASTLADELELRTAKRSRTIGVALKDRSAIMPMGRMGDAAYWYVGGKEGRFVTSTWYRGQLPDWLQRFNEQELPAKYLDRTWATLLPIDRYQSFGPDDNPYELPLADRVKPTLPLDLGALRAAGEDLDLLVYTPWGNTITTDLAIAAIEGEDLGADDVTDLLAISYSSPDELGHLMGPRALEVEDMYLRLDGELARLLHYLDRKIGTGKYTLFLTADHGGADVPALLKDAGASAGYTAMRDLAQWLDDHGFAGQVEKVRPGQIYLRPEAHDGAADEVAHVLSYHPGVSTALSAHSLLRMEELRGEARAMARGFMPTRCGDVAYTLRPGYMEEEYGSGGKGTSHGSPWNYDTHVPVFFFGKGVVPGEVLRRTSIVDVAPTVAALVGMARPNACIGEVVHEVVRTR